MARTPSSAARQALLNVCGELITQHGVKALSIDDVVQRSGVAKTTLYRHFGGLDGLVFALVGSRVQAAPQRDTGSLRTDLRDIQRAYLALFESPLQRELFVWMTTNAMQNPAAAALFRSTRFDQRGPTVVALQRAIARGEVPPTIDIQLAMHLIQGTMISKRVIGDERLTEVEFNELTDMMLAALQQGVKPSRPMRSKRPPSTTPSTEDIDD
jgi:AcrR family transcriptional regulator